MILHIEHPYLHDYLVQTAQSTYRYSLNRQGMPIDPEGFPEDKTASHSLSSDENYTPQQPIIAQYSSNSNKKNNR
jgi:hypothetical protein